MKTIGEWMAEAPTELREALSSVPLLNSLRQHRNSLFQLPGMYDGAMSEACRARMRSQYAALGEFLEALKQRSA